MQRESEASSRSSELINRGFPLATKLALLAGPLFISLPHAWRMLTLQNLSELRPDMRLEDTYHYLSVEIVYSILAMPVALLSDSVIGTTITLISFVGLVGLTPLLGSLSAMPGISVMARTSLAKVAVGFAGMGIIGTVLERSFYVSLMNVNSPKFRIYCFLYFYLGNLWQIINGLVIFVPKFLPFLSGNNDTIRASIQLVYHCLLWTIMIAIYSIVCRLQPPNYPGGNSFKVLVCIYVAIFYSVRMIWAKLRWKDVPYRDAFEACEKWFPRVVVRETKQTFKLLMVLMCLMYSFGMELVLRTIWFHQDDELSRHPKNSAISLFPMEWSLLLYLVPLYPIVNFLVIPFIQKKLHVRMTDLRLLGIALVFYNLSYITTMALEWAVLSESTSHPHSTNIAFRIYNCMSPVSWTVTHRELTPASIILPSRMSRMYVNDVAGNYNISLNSTDFNYVQTLRMEKGKSVVFILRENELERFTAMERQLSAKPNHYHEDTHLFVVNCLANTTDEYLINKKVVVSWKTKKFPSKHSSITSNITHLVLLDGEEDITLKIGQKEFDTTMQMNDHGVYSIMFYDSWDGEDEGYELETVSVGFVYTRNWVHLQIILLAVAISVGQIPAVHYTYINAPPDLLTTCFSFHRCASAVSTFLIWYITKTYGLGPGPSTVSTMLVVMFTVFFVFLSLSDLVADEEARPRRRRSARDSTSRDADTASLTSDSGSLKFMKSQMFQR